MNSRPNIAPDCLLTIVATHLPTMWYTSTRSPTNRLLAVASEIPPQADFETHGRVFHSVDAADFDRADVLVPWVLPALLADGFSFQFLAGLRHLALQQADHFAHFTSEKTPQFAFRPSRQTAAPKGHFW